MSEDKIDTLIECMTPNVSENIRNEFKKHLEVYYRKKHWEKIAPIIMSWGETVGDEIGTRIAKDIKEALSET